jgi:hypothetical protein
MEQNYLTHWGIKGMKWGVRRFQNKDGSLTPAGRKRYNDDAPDTSKSEVKARKKAQKALKKGRFDHLSDEELIKAINRARLEDTLQSLRPEQVSAGKKFTETLKNDILIPIVKNTGQTFVNKQVDKLVDKFLGVKPDELATLKKEFDILDYKSKIDEIKTGKPRAKNWEEMKKKQEWENGEKSKNNPDNNKKSDESSTSNTKTSKTDEPSKSTNKTSKDDDVERVVATPDMIIGKGTSWGSSKQTKSTNVNYDIYDFVNDAANTTMSSVSSKQISAGESFIAGLLEPPKDQ